jgi:hypothetical protein
MKQIKKLSLLLILIILFSSLISLALAEEYVFDENFCDNEIYGYELLGNDFYLLCEEPFEDQYYDSFEEYGGYEAFMASIGKEVPEYEAEAEVESEPVILDPNNPFDAYIMWDLGINEIDDVEEDYFSETQTEDYELDITSPNNIETIPEEILLTEDVVDSINTNQDEIIEVDSVTKPERTYFQNNVLDPILDREGSDDSNLMNYLMYLGIGLILLLGIYIVLHSLAKKHEEKKQILVAYSYISLLKQKNYTDTQIKQYFMEKGYEEDFINKVLKNHPCRHPLLTIDNQGPVPLPPPGFHPGILFTSTFLLLSSIPIFLKFFSTITISLLVKYGLVIKHSSHLFLM